MAFPFIGETNFEDGTTSEWSSETDTDSKLNIEHYSSSIAKLGQPVPYRGAYQMVVDLSKGTNDAYLQQDTIFDAAGSTTQFVRFQFYASTNLTMATTDEFVIFRLQSAGPVDEGVVVINYTTANGYRIGIGETAGTQFLPISLGKWHTVEVKYVVDSGAGNDGTLTLWLDGSQATVVSGLDQGAITQGRLGAMGIDAGTTAGILCFDQLIVDDARIYPISIRYPQDVLLTKSGHVFVGSGCVENVTLLSGGATDNVLTIYDTDVAGTNDAVNTKLELKNVVASDVVDPAGVPVELQRGCYVKLAGTNPRALIKIGYAQGYWSDGRIKQHASNRIPAPGGW